MESYIFKWASRKHQLGAWKAISITFLNWCLSFQSQNFEVEELEMIFSIWVFFWSFNLKFEFWRKRALIGTFVFKKLKVSTFCLKFEVDLFEFWSLKWKFELLSLNLNAEVWLWMKQQLIKFLAYLVRNTGNAMKIDFLCKRYIMCHKYRAV